MTNANGIRCLAGITLAAAVGAGAALSPPAQARTPSSAIVAAHPERATVTIQRAFNLSCYNAVPLTVFVDGKPVSAMGVGQTIKLLVAPGQYRVGVAAGRGHGAVGTPQGMALTVMPGRATALLASLGPGGSTLRPLAH